MDLNRVSVEPLARNIHFPTEDEFDYGGYEVYWSMLIYYLYMERVFPYDREAATKLIQFVVEKRGKQMKLFGEELRGGYGIQISKEV